MSEKVSSFFNVQTAKFRYVFYLVTWNDFVTPIREELEKQIDAFGEVLASKGKVVQAFRSMSGTTFKEVMDKPWKPELQHRLENDVDPFLLVIERDFASFDPSQHPWSIIWFSDFQQRPDSIYRLFGALARKTRQEEDVFSYLRSLAVKQKYMRWAKHFELRTPQLFGISIDVRAILEDLAGLKD